MVYKEKDIIKLLKERIESCHKTLLWARTDHSCPKEYVEGFRCRLDELLLLYSDIKQLVFIEVCKELKIKYEDVSIQGGSE